MLGTPGIPGVRTGSPRPGGASLSRRRYSCGRCSGSISWGAIPPYSAVHVTYAVTFSTKSGAMILGVPEIREHSRGSIFGTSFRSVAGKGIQKKKQYLVFKKMAGVSLSIALSNYFIFYFPEMVLTIDKLISP